MADWSGFAEVLPEDDDWSGFQEVKPEPRVRQQGTLEPVTAKAGDPWAEFQEVPGTAAKPSPTPAPTTGTAPTATLMPSGQVHDGDTFRLTDGPNARLYGADAFELDQPGRHLDGATYPLGSDARAAFVPMVGNGATVRPVGGQMTYGRPVVTVEHNGVDAGIEMVRQGYALPEPRYLTDTDKRAAMIAVQRDAIARERGAYAGQYQNPGEFRKEGADAEWRGKLPMSGADASEWQALMRTPGVTDGQVGAWLQSRGQKAENIGNILSLVRRNPQADLRPYWQQYDAEGKPVAPAVSFGARQAAALAEGVPDVTGMPAQVFHDTPWVFGAGGQLASSILGVVDAAGHVFNGDGPSSTKPEYSVKARDAVGKRGADEVLVSADASDKPRTGWRYSAPAVAQYKVAVAHGDLGQAMKILQDNAQQGFVVPASTAGSVARQIEFKRKHPGAPYPATGPIGYDEIDAWAAQQHAKADAPVGGVEFQRDIMHKAGVGQLDERYAPQSTGERYLQSVERMLPSAVLPIAGEGMLAGRVGREMLGTGLVGTVGAGIGGQVADDVAPGSPVAMLLGQLVGGGVGGLAGRRAVTGRTPRVEAPEGSAYPDQVAAPEPVRPMGSPDVSTLPDPAPAPPREPVAANIPSLDEASPLGPKSVLSSVPAKGKSGVSVVNEDGHLVTAVYRDADGTARGVAQFPISEEARRLYERASVYVDPVVRRNGIARQLYDALENEGYPVSELSGAGDITPEGAAFINSRRAAAGDRTEAMAAEMETPSISAPVDMEAPGAAAQRPRPLLDPATDAERAAMAERIEPGDLLPVPASRVADVEEAAAIEAGRFASVKAPNEKAELASRNIPSPNDATRTLPKRGPLDLVTWLRTEGGLRPEGGELRHYGITNRARLGLDFAEGEHRLGKLVDPENGMGYDEAAQRAWDAGYFPDHAEPPTISEFLDALSDTHSGRSRHFLPDDLPEIDRFHAARSTRHAVEQAKQEGAPLIEDRGQPVTLDDLEANAAPVEAYFEWGENAPDFAGNIRLFNLDSPQSIGRALANVERNAGGFDAATRGRITQAETERLAAELNMTPDQLLARRKGQALNAEQALAARQIMAKSGNELVNLAKRTKAKIDAGGASDADLAAFRAAVVRHAAIQEQVSGATAEAGRTLSQFRMTADSRVVRGEILKRMAEQGGGEQGALDAADAIIEAVGTGGNDPGRLNATVAALQRPGLKDMAMELYINNILSSPRTHAVNILSNTLTSLAQLPEQAVAATVGAVRKTLPGQAATDRVLYSEIGARAAGMLNGVKEGLIEGWRTLKTGEASDLVSKVETRHQRAIPGIAGSLIRLPTRLLAVEDEIFKGIARRGDIAAQAMRKAYGEGLRGDALKRRAAELTSSPTPEMLEQAADFARYVTFQRQLGPRGSAVSNLIEKAPELRPFVTFVRTPTNLLKFAVERSPLAPFLKEWRSDFMAGGAKRDTAIARALVGSGAIMLAMEGAKRGLITGNGPSDQNARRTWLSSGAQPYSVKIGDTWYSYGRLDPFSMTIGLAADWHDVEQYATPEERERMNALLVTTTMEHMKELPWLEGFGRLGNLLTDPERYGPDFVNSTAASFVPFSALQAQTAQSLDPVQREAKTLLDKIKSRTPWLSKTLPAKRDAMGEPIGAGNGGGLATFSPVYARTDSGDKVTKTLLAEGISIGLPQRSFADPDNEGAKIDLTPEQFSFYLEASGNIMRPELESLVGGEDWEQMTPAERKKAVGEIVRDARADAREMVVAQVRPKAAATPQPPGVNGLPDPWMEFPEER